MAGTDEDAVAAADDDALYVLTAVLLTPAKFPSVLGDDYPEACAALGLAPLADGYGLVLGQDGEGARWTVVIDDVSLVAVAIASWDCGMEYDLSPDERTVVAALPGWPLAVAVSAPGRPRSARPRPRARGAAPAAARRTPTAWGPAQRRLGRRRDRAAVGALARADRRQRLRALGGCRGRRRRTPGTRRTRRRTEGEGETGRDRPGIRRVLAEARAYVDTPPPLGRVRSSFAPGDARTLRADGPGWSLVARTDDIAFVLLDEEPGEVLPVGRGPGAARPPGGLDKMAVRPS